MATQADGTVYINSSIDTDGFTAGGKEIEAAARRAAKTVKGIGDAARIALERQTAAFVKSNQLYAQQEQKVKNLEKQLEEMSKQTVQTDAFKEIQKQIDTDTAKLNRLVQTQEEFLETGGSKDSVAYQRRLMQIDELRNSIEYAKSEQAELLADNQAYQPVDTSAITNKLIVESQRLQQMGEALNVSYDSLKSKVEQYGGSIAGAAQKHELLRKALSSVAGAAKKAGAAMLLFHKNTKKSNGSIGTGIKNMLKYTLGISSLLMLFRKIKSAVKEGMQNLAQYSDETNTHLSALKSSMTQLKNSIATAFNPILTVIEPILTRFINLLSQVITYVGMFFAALTGANSFTKAVAVQEDYAASLGETADNAKEAKKYLSGLDEVRTYSEDKDTSGGGYQAPTPAEMFETVPIESKIKEFADKVKQTLSEMFAPLKEAWEKYGAPILEKIESIYNKIKEFIERIINSTVEWFKGLNWEPLLQSIDNLLEKLQPLIDLILDGLAWAYENVLLPFGQWALEEAVPAVIDLFSSALGVLVEVLETLKPLGEWLWDNFLQPIAEFVGDAFVAGLELITDVLNKLSDGIAKWRESGGMDKIIESLESAKEWLVDIFTRIHDGYEKYMKPVLEKLGQRFKEVMDGPVGETIEKVKNLIGKLSEAFQLLWNNVLDPLFKWIADNIMPILAPIVDFLGNTVITIIETVIEVIGGVVDVLSGILDFIIGVFTGDWERAWKGIEEIVTGIWEQISSVIKGIVNLIIGLINGMISGVVSGINTIINAMNALHFDIPDWVPVLGGKSFEFNISTITAPQIPYLATGAVIPPNAPFMAVLGDQKRGTNIETPEALLRKIVREESGNSGVGIKEIRIPLYLSGSQVLEVILNEAQLSQLTDGRNPFELA